MLQMNWLPTATDFRERLTAAIQAEEGRSLEALASLAQTRLDFLQSLQLDKALTRIRRTSAPGFSNVRLAILASTTVDHLAPAVRVAGLRRRILFDVHTGAYGQYRQDVLGHSSSLHDFKPDTILFSVTAREAIAGIPVSAGEADAESALQGFIADLRLLWQKARTTFNASVIQQTVLNTAEPLFGSHDRMIAAAPTRLIARLNDKMAAAALEDGVLLLDIARASERDGLAAWFDTRRWFEGKFEIAPQASPMYGELAARVIAAQRGLSRKCLVLDLDNTLWGGTIGDDGVEGIRLGQGSAPGEAHLALQRYAKELKERGVVLAVCSKNDPAIAELPFRNHPEMVLRRDDIAAFIANWNDKSENLTLIAKQLNIGLDSLVFVDDNPAERARIRESLSSVAVPELPADVADYVATLAEAGYFEAVSFTSEDRRRSEQYAANLEREAAQSAAQSLDEFLAGLKMSVAFGAFAPLNLPRVTQLINKTNQFNTTARRYTAEEVASRAASRDALTLQFRLLDRFGDNGIVSTMILSPVCDRPEVLEIESWVMSCRVFGRGLEHEVMNVAVTAAKKRGVRAFSARYVPTEKNRVIEQLYPDLGFAPVQPPAADGRASHWLLELAGYTARKTHIAHAGEAP